MGKTIVQVKKDEIECTVDFRFEAVKNTELNDETPTVPVSVDEDGIPSERKLPVEKSLLKVIATI